MDSSRRPMNYLCCVTSMLLLLCSLLLLVSLTSPPLKQGGNSGGSRWKRYCERKKQEALAMSSKRKFGVTMAGRVLFKQSNVVRKSPRKAVKTRLNFRSNVAGIIKLVYAVNLREVHLAHLRTTPFWIMFEAILSNQLDHTEFRKGDDLIVRIVKSYNVREGKFVLGGRGVDLTVDDVKLLFGLQGGSAFLDMTPRPRPASDFVQRRCPGTSRITAKLVKDLLMDASVGDTPRDHEDTAKFLCLYLCGKLFFATSGETISWTLIRYVDNFDAMKLYDWSAAVRNMLMCSVRDFHRKPEKVTGCVVALTYWLCEHTNIVKAKHVRRFPRFRPVHTVCVTQPVPQVPLQML